METRLVWNRIPRTGKGTAMVKPGSQDDPSRTRMARGLAQKIQSFAQAGVTHIRRGVDVEQLAGSPGEAGPATCDWGAPRPAPSQPQPASAPADDRVAALERLRCKVAVCTRCPHLARTRQNTVFGVGNPYPRLVFLGEAPGADEDAQGIPFVGRAGQKLTEIIERGMGLRREDVYILNTIKCRPPGNRVPTPDEAANCREYLDAQLEILKPEFVCCLGLTAAQHLLGTAEPLGRLRGRLYDYRGMRVVCTYHPSYILRFPEVGRPAVWQDIQMLMKAMGLPLPGK